MPLFDFKCPDCGDITELRVGSEETPECPKCQVPLEKLPAVFGGYKIRGDNSSSQTPKKFRGGR